jgi:two-component system, sensor histidine kinase FlrB
MALQCGLRMSSSFSSPHESPHEADHALARAFRSFTEAAGSLERTYGQLQSQVARLRQELEVTNRNLTLSLEENRHIRERLRHILEGLPCGVLVAESGKRITILNPEAVRLIGAKPENLEGLPPDLAAVLDEVQFSGEERELEFSAAGVGRVWIAVRYARLEANAEAESSIFILRDISATKQMEQERENLSQQRALAEMSAVLAHEIRNPLGSLELFAGLLAESGLEGENRRWIEHVQAGLRSLSSTVNNVLDLHTQPPPERVAIDAGEVLGWAYDFLLPLAHQARAEFQIVNHLHGVFVLADRHLLEQLVLNLALNAFHFMPGGGWLLVVGKQQVPDGIQIEVKDTGSGILKQDLPRIFEPGFTTRPGSTGLGLTVCRRIVEQHGGTIMAESELGHGTTFRVRLPQTCAPRPCSSQGSMIVEQAAAVAAIVERSAKENGVESTADC